MMDREAGRLNLFLACALPVPVHAALVHEPNDVILSLGLLPLPFEGGWYAETYRAVHAIEPAALPPGYPGPRALATAIYYLLTPDTFSRMHRLRGDEIYHFYLGDPVELVVLHPDGAGDRVILGQDLTVGMRVQHRVPGGNWQGSRLLPGGRFALMGTTMAPGFDLADFEPGSRSALTASHPDLVEAIARLTPGE